MKRGYEQVPRAALAVGAGLIAVAVYASLTRQMSWVKLVLFWIGVGAVAYFMLHHIFSSIDTFREHQRVRRYKASHRVLYAALLLAGLAGAAIFTRRAMEAWELPAAYWEFVEEIPAAPNQYQARWVFGNQRYERALQLREIQLLELGAVALHEKGGLLEISCRVDSQPLVAAEASNTNVQRFLLPEHFEIPPLSTTTIQLELKFRHRFAIYDMAAIYQSGPAPHGLEAKSAVLKSASAGHYILVEPPHAGLIDFAQLARLAQRPSWHTREAVIYALGRSRHPQAWQALQDLLKVNDPRVQGAVCQAMIYLGDPRATAALMQLVKRNKNPQAVRALATIAAPEGVDFLLKLLTDAKAESFLRLAAASMIGEAKLHAAAPALQALVKDKSKNADFTLKREALTALARLDKCAATHVAITAVQDFPDPRQIRVCLEAVSELEHEEMLPLLADWLGNWRRYDLEADDVQTMLSYIVSGDHRDMTEVLVDALLHEATAEMQFKYVAALSALAGNDFGQIEFPEIGYGAQEGNRRVINAWNRWWGRARNQEIYAEQISPLPVGNKI